MELQPSHKKILEYLDKYGSVNTFKLSKDIRIDRGAIIKLVEELTKEGLTKFRSGTVIKGDKLAADQKIIESEEKKPVSKPIVVSKKPKKSMILRDKQSGLEKVKEKTRRLENNWLKKEEELKKDIEDLQTQRDKTAQKLSKEKALLCQLRKEKRELEKSLAVWESSLKQREESVQKKEEDIQKRKESVSVAEKRLEREKEKLKEKKIKPRATTKKIKPVSKPKIEKPFASISSSTSKQSSELLEQSSRKARTFEKIVVSKTETEKPEIMPKGLLQPTTEIGKEEIEDKFHDLIEQEISLLKQRRIGEARSIHLQIKDMISEITDTDQRKMIITDWNRIKDIY